MSLTTNRRDQDFVLYEMLGIDSLFNTEKFREFSRDTFDMTLDMAYRLGEKEVLPRLMEADREGARLEDGNVHVPRCYHDLQKIMAEGGWFTVAAPQDAGGQGARLAAGEALDAVDFSGQVRGVELAAQRFIRPGVSTMAGETISTGTRFQTGWGFSSSRPSSSLAMRS